MNIYSLSLWKKVRPNWLFFSLLLGFGVQYFHIRFLILGVPLGYLLLWIPFVVFVAVNFIVLTPISAVSYVLYYPGNIKKLKRFYGRWFKIKFKVFPYLSYLSPIYFKNPLTTFLILLNRFYSAKKRSVWFSFAIINEKNYMSSNNLFNNILIPFLIQNKLDWISPLVKNNEKNICLRDVFLEWLAEIDVSILQNSQDFSLNIFNQVKSLCFDMGQQGVDVNRAQFLFKDINVCNELFFEYQKGSCLCEREKLQKSVAIASKMTQPSLKHRI